MTQNDLFKKYTDLKTLERIVDFETVGEMWQKSVADYASSIAITDDGAEYTYRSMDEAVARFRTVLTQRGLGKGDRVGIYCPNSAAFIKAFLAVTTIGATAVLLPPHLDAMTVFGCSFKFGLKGLVFFDALAEKTAVLAEKNPRVERINVSDTAESCTEAAAVDGDSECAILFTGGTTGASKGAILSHRAIMRGVKNGCFGYRDVFEQRYFLILPLTHVFGLIRNTLTSLYTGSNLFICRNSKDMFKDMAAFKPTILILVPALAEMALNLSKQFGRNMLGESVKYIICGASAVAPYLVKAYADYGILLFPGYGLTESANLVSGNPEAARKPDSVGYIYPGMDYKIVDGELWLKGMNMMIGYVGEEENAAAYENGWFKTGDLVRIDDEGFLYITGRTKEVIVLSTGENISPAELETEFYALDTVADCLIYDCEDNGRQILAIEVLPRMSVLKAVGGEDPMAFLKAQIEKVNETLPSFARINKIIIRDSDFVRSPNMKIVRNQNGIDKK